MGSVASMAEANANQINEGLVPVVAAYQNVTIDPKYTYCLSASDHPGLLFVTNPLKENGENYFTWRRNMLNALVTKNKAGFVNGRIEKPDVNSRDFEPWVQCNAMQLCCHGSRTRSIKNYKIEQHMRKPPMKGRDESFGTKRTRSRTCGEPASGGRGNTSLNSQTSAASSGFAGIVDGCAGTSPIPGLLAKQHQQLLALLCSDTSPSANLVNDMSGKKFKHWIIDTEATDHVCSNIDQLFDPLMHPKIPPVQIPSGDYARIHALGTVKLDKKLVLKNVL
ncbi:hypothetical protein RJ640_007169 [Escallonia rubra]|uniref:Retrotransposon Copia-like N-terminal domain-containing protein n=1 Tax=Escallonia rubra TaxID=112253 RepID=A0AA88QTS4_9ASTE|nr:hypothetical protein RJ640_007169 [Escallonia rubra]